MSRLIYILAALVAVAIVWAALRPEQQEIADSVKAAKTVIAAIPEHKAELVQAFDDPKRNQWMYVPGPRPGVSYKMMTAAQQQAGLNLLRASLSEAGYKKVSAIRALEPVLREMENGNAGRDPDLYWFIFFGEPSEKGTWAWRYEGHHVSFTFTYVNGHIASSTPMFLGSNPAEVRSGPQKGERILRDEEERGRALLLSLTDSQRKEAVIGESAPADIGTSNSRKAGIQEDKGVAFKDLDKEQQKHLKELVDLYASALKPAAKAQRLSRIKDWNAVKFAWMGSPIPGKGHYYRIQGATFLIEYDNTQNDANHIHTVWRDFNGDFGEDALAEHYDHDHNHRDGDAHPH